MPVAIDLSEDEFVVHETTMIHIGEDIEATSEEP